MKLEGKIMKTRRGHLYVQLCFPEVVEQMSLDFKQPRSVEASLFVQKAQQVSQRQDGIPEIVEQLTLDDFFDENRCSVLKGGDEK